jgi:hypothetical protein
MGEDEIKLSRAELMRRAGAAALLVSGVPGARRAYGARGIPGAEAFDAEVATAWFDLSLELVRATPGYSPPVASRAFGCAGLTLYEAVVPGLAGFRSLVEVFPGLGHVGAGSNAAYDWPAVAPPGPVPDGAGGAAGGHRGARSVLRGHSRAGSAHALRPARARGGRGDLRVDED